jgi:hypothetical protein
MIKPTGTSSLQEVSFCDGDLFGRGGANQEEVTINETYGFGYKVQSHSSLSSAVLTFH